MPPVMEVYSTGEDTQHSGSGVYFFQGIQKMPSGSISTHSKFVKVDIHTVGKYTGYYVVFFGRATRYRPEAFEGTWLKVRVAPKGD